MPTVLVPVEAPTNVTLKAHEKPRNISINWTHIPDFQWKGNKTGYVIHYQKIKIGGVPTVAPKEVELIPYIDSYILPLEVFTEYIISITGRTPIGEGPKSLPQVLGKHSTLFFLVTDLVKTTQNE